MNNSYAIQSTILVISQSTVIDNILEKIEWERVITCLIAIYKGKID